jgi:hypothetical protein
MYEFTFRDTLTSEIIILFGYDTKDAFERTTLDNSNWRYKFIRMDEAD